MIELIDWQEITEELGEARWRDDLVILPRQSRLLLAKLVQENRFLSRDSQQIYYGPDSQAELYDAAKTAYNSLNNPLQTDLIDMFINGDLVVNNDDLVVDESTGRVGIGTAVPGYELDVWSPGNTAIRAYASGTGYPFIVAQRVGGEAVKLQVLPGSGNMGTQSNHPLGLIANNAVKATVHTDGGVSLASPVGGSKGQGTINLSTAYYVNGLPVVQARKTGWSPGTGTASRATFATSTVTLESLAQRFKALLDDLIAHGLIGA